MSYILDALRRAEAERERGSVPGVHSQQFPTLAADDEAPRRPVWLIGAVVVLALALAGVLAWSLGRGDPPRPVSIAVAPSVPTAGTGVVPPMTAPTVLPSIAPPPMAAPPAPAVAPQPVPATPAARPSSATPAAARIAAAAPRHATATATATATTAAADPRRTQRSAAAAGVTAADDDRIYAEAELPEPVRKTLPKLAFGGSSWSSEASSRMVIWNGRVFHEGDSIAPGVVLRRINRKSAVLSAKGYRYEVGW